MKLQVLSDERFSCHFCTNCCRNWHVELVADEADRIEALAWPSGDPLHGAAVLLRHAGKTFIAHRADGPCIFLNLSDGRCRIHEQFGARRQAGGVQALSIPIIPTFKGEATVSGRYDCPTVRRNEGVPYAHDLPLLRQLVSAVRLSDGFDEATRCHLEGEQIEAVCEYIGTMMAAFEGDERKVLFIAYLCDGLAATMAGDPDRGALARAFPILRDEVEAATSLPMSPPGWVARTGFRTLLGTYLRRDEDVLDGRAGRFGRALGMGAMVLGFGNPRRLGVGHPSARVRKARLFRSSDPPADEPTFGLFWRMVRNRLDSFQFMGSANGGRNFLQGLRSLALLYPLVRAAAKLNASARGAGRIEIEDVDCAVAAIEHSYGRQAMLSRPSSRSIEKLLLDRQTFTRLVRTV